MIEIKLFGSIEISRAGKAITGFRSQKTLALLAYLISEGRPVTRDYLAGLVWPDSTQKQALGLLRRSLYNLNSKLPDLLDIDRRTIAFSPNVPARVDTQRFAELSTLPDIAAWEEAARLYSAPFLEGIYLDDSPTFEQWLITEQQRWRDLVDTLLDRLVQALIDRGEYGAALVYANRRVALAPWSEEAHRLTMRLLSYLGQYNEALVQYQTCQQVLNEELGVDPGAETTKLYTQIWAARTSPRHNLPPQPTPFIGRHEEIERLVEMLGQPNCRLLSIVGPGGIGKTRLALQVAKAHSERFLNGCTFVNLAAVNSPDNLIGTLSDTLHLSSAGKADLWTRTLTYLQPQERLLILDNFEQLLRPDDQTENPALSMLVDILHQAVDVKLLITTREPLRLRWEQVFDLQGLSYPNHGDISQFETYDAIQLFLSHLGRVQRRNAMPEPDWPGMAHICRLTDGVPLAIELAAGLTQTQGCESIATAIEQNISVLSTSMWDAPPRHRSLWATFDYSWQRLTSREQTVFRQLSVFQGGFDLEAAKQVVHASETSLSRLVDKSLLRLAPDGRYDVHELLRQFGAAKLSETATQQALTQEQHSRYYATLLEQQGVHLKGSPHQTKALAIIAQEIDNARTSWQWALDNEQLAILSQAVEGLGHFFEIRSRLQEGEWLFGQAADRLRQIAKQPDIDQALAHLLLGRILAWQGVYAHRLGQLDKSREVSEQSLAALEALGEAAKQQTMLARFSLGIVDGLYAGNLAESQRHFAVNKRIAEETNALWELSAALQLLGMVAIDQGSLIEARTYYTESLAISQEMNDQWGMGIALGNLSEATCRLEDFETAKELAQEAYNTNLAIDHQVGMLYALQCLGNANYGLEDYATARDCFREALELGLQVGVLPELLDVLPYFAELLITCDQAEQAIALLTTCVAHSASPDWVKSKANAMLDRIRASSSPQGLAPAQGQTRELSAIVAEILAAEVPRYELGAFG
ncbi:MAG: AAA family ATPase [Anaerolineae bacterium]|nr:AAA family ATPase [Anaerolineae bacterium]